MNINWYRYRQEYSIRFHSSEVRMDVGGRRTSRRRRRRIMRIFFQSRRDFFIVSLRDTIRVADT